VTTSPAAGARSATGPEKARQPTPPLAAQAVPADWMSLGGCRDADSELFFPISSLGPAQQQIAEAKAVCAACPVRAACLSYAVETGQPAGIWGGTTEDERRHIRSAKTARPASPPSGGARPRAREHAPDHQGRATDGGNHG
jgi:WhiB family transcriptional regulator, redox-sensing transcriptional regulator